MLLSASSPSAWIDVEVGETEMDRAEEDEEIEGAVRDDEGDRAGVTEVEHDDEAED